MIRKTFISGVTALAIATTGLTAAPARASDDTGKIILGVAALAVIGTVIAKSKKDDHVVSRNRGFSHSQHKSYSKSHRRAHSKKRHRAHSRKHGHKSHRRHNRYHQYQYGTGGSRQYRNQYWK